MPSSKNLTLLQHIVSNLDIEPHVAGTITQDSLNASPFAKGKIDPVGTIGMLNHSLRDSRPSLTLLVLGLLARYALELERYTTSAGAADDIEAFLSAVEAHRHVAAPPATTPRG